MNIYWKWYLFLSALGTIAMIASLLWDDYKKGKSASYGTSIYGYNIGRLRGRGYFLRTPPLTWIALFFTLPIVNITIISVGFIYFLKFVIFKKSWNDKDN